MSLATLLLGMAAVAAAESSRLVPAAAKPDAEWKNYPTRTLEDFPGLAAAPADSALGKYGGLLAHKEKATGFFHTAKVGNRWWLVR